MKRNMQPVLTVRTREQRKHMRIMHDAFACTKHFYQFALIQTYFHSHLAQDKRSPET